MLSPVKLVLLTNGVTVWHAGCAVRGHRGAQFICCDGFCCAPIFIKKLYNRPLIRLSSFNLIFIYSVSYQQRFHDLSGAVNTAECSGSGIFPVRPIWETNFVGSDLGIRNSNNGVIVALVIIG